MERTLEDGVVIVTLGGKSLEVPIKTETVKHDDGKQDVTIHIPSLTTLSTGEK